MRGYRGLTLLEVSVALVCFTLFLFGGLRLYLDVIRQQEAMTARRQAQHVLLSAHEEERPNLFLQEIGVHELPEVTLEGRTFQRRLTLSKTPDFPEDELRKVEYTVEYRLKGEAKALQRTYLVSRYE